MKRILLLSVLIYTTIQISYGQPGTPDTGFNNTGVALSDIGKPHFNQSYFGAFKVLLGNNGTLIYTVVNAPGAIFITKRHSNGSLDTSYGNKGISVIAALGGGDAIIQPDGKIIVSGGVSRSEFSSDVAIARFNTNGTLDNTFSGDGLQTDNFGVTTSFARSMALQADGKIVVTGSSNGFLLARYNTDGGIDNTFSCEGNHTNNTGVDVPESVVIQKDGKIVVSGIKPVVGNNKFSLSRYNTDGSLDTSFGVQGNQLTSFEEGSATAYSSILQPDGKVIVAGYVRLSVFPNISELALARYTSNGSPDSTFDSDGKMTTGPLMPFYTNQASIALQGDQKIVVASSILNNGNGDFAVLRFNNNGSPDVSFSGDGKQTTDFNGILDYSASLAIEKNGKILVAGEAFVPPGSTGNFALCRYNTNGAPDTTFGRMGLIQENLKQGYTVYKGVAVQKDKKVVTAGYTWNGEKFIFAVTRYNLTGIPDTTFSGDGTKTTSFGAGDAVANSIAIQEDGRVVVGGSSGNPVHRNFALARYTINGEADSTFGVAGKQEIAFGTAGDDYANAIAVQVDGKIIAVGSAKSNAALIRLNTNGQLDFTFGGGDGKQVMNLDFSTANGLALEKSGRIVIAGSFGPNYALARYTANGFLDKSFGEMGRVRGNFKYNYLSANSLALQNDGKIIAAANVDYLESANSFALARYTVLGKIDSSFGNYGRVISSGYADYVNSIAIQNEGEIIVGGKRNNHSAVTRFTLNGSVDSTFGLNGTQVTQISAAQDVNNAIIIDSNALYAAGTALLPRNLGTVIKFLLKADTALPLVNLIYGGNHSLSMLTQKGAGPVDLPHIKYFTRK